MSAGDPSGDRLGAALLDALRARGVTVEAAGLGGPALRAAGFTEVASMESVAVMGFAEVIRHLPAIRRARAAILDLLARRPDAIFLPIDSPGLNLGLARAARRMGRNVVYYVCPQIWAWGYGRVRRLREDVDLTLLLFRFEEAILGREGVRARWVGHPAGALSANPEQREEARRTLGIASSETLIAILPGSRRGEVRRHLEPMLDAAARLVNHVRGLRVAVSDAGPVAGVASHGRIAHLWGLIGPIHHRGDSETLLRAADLALVASGTATLETAALGVPMVIVYKTGALNYAIARRMVRLPRIGLANIVAESDAAPERIQGNATGPRIASALAKLLDAPAERERQRAAFSSLSERLGGAGSAGRAADALLEFISERRPAAAAASSG
ncbi:MAG TPA: lipid-A-disaccharide synthase [Anaeromyxobacter sp.]